MKLDGVNELGKIREYCVTARAWAISPFFSVEHIFFDQND